MLSDRSDSVGGEISRYHTDVDPERPNNSHSLLLNLIGEGKRVLEVGPATGYMTQVLNERGCQVTCIEIDERAAEVAEAYCRRMLIGDVESLDVWAELGEERFDVILFGDVLEHLRDPVGVLERARRLLGDTGIVLASIPNVSHGSVRLSLLKGNFDPTERGLLDDSHLRFFTRQTIQEMFTGAGFAITAWDATREDFFGTEIGLVERDFPAGLVAALRTEPDASVYQFIVTASPSHRASDVPEAGALAGKAVALLTGREASEARLRAEVEQLQAGIEERERELIAVHAQLNEIVSSIGFRILSRYRKVIRLVAPWGTKRGGLFTAISRTLHILSTEGLKPLLQRVPQWRLWLPRLWQEAPAGSGLNEQYDDWLKRHALTDARLQEIRHEITRMSFAPMVSVVMPVFNTEGRWLEPAIESVLSQLYGTWELCIVDDGSTRGETAEVLDIYAARDERIRIERSPQNEGIVGASNRALRMASGEFIALLDHDDELKPDALYEVVKLLNEDRDLDYIYTDEDRRELDGRLVDPFFKPDWSPDLLLSLNFVTHLSVFRKSLIAHLGGFRPGYDGAQDWDLQLRVTEATDRIGHIPLPLYTWRKIPGSAAASSTAKPYAYEAAKRAIEEAIQRRGVPGEVEQGAVKGYFRVRYAIESPPRVAILIPTRDRLDMLRRCVESIRRNTDYPNYEIVIIDNESKDPATLEYLASFGGRVIPTAGEFNFSRINNEAAQRVDAEALLFLNNDTEVLHPEWLSAMVEHVQRPEVGAVGARLFFPNGEVQHEGVLVGPGKGLAGHVNHGGYYKLGDVIRNFSAVTAACMLTRREVFLEVGGFEEKLGVAYNDIDLCLKMREKGYTIVYTPYARLRHHEGGTRGRVIPMDDAELFRSRWSANGIYRDPYYNPNLSLRFPFTIKTRDEELHEV